jgi:hypothetical protein
MKGRLTLVILGRGPELGFLSHDESETLYTDGVVRREPSESHLVRRKPPESHCDVYRACNTAGKNGCE